MISPHLDQLAPTDLPQRLGRYELQSVLGEGGMARVFRAELVGPAGFRKQVALKVIKSGVIEQSNSTTVEAFIREARLGGLLRHPNIVDVYELGDAAGQLFIAMELVEGQTLAQHIRSGNRPPAAVVLEVASGIAAGLDSAHSLSSEGLPAGLVHRDLKPSNVLVSWDGEVKIVDFGIAITHHGALVAAKESATSLVGTLSYMSPEQLLKEPLNGRSDLFSLGLVLAEFATARRMPRRYLFRKMMAGGDVRSPMEFAEPLAAVEEAVPGLRRILLRCLEPFADARYPSAAELLAELDALRSRVGFEPRLRNWLPPGGSGSARPETVADATAVRGGALIDETGSENELTTLVTNARRARTNLSADLDKFVGRESELAELAERFAAGGRLVTVKGAGGAGKTRFARRFARSRWDQLTGGAWFVDLTEARTGIGIVHATAATLEVPLLGEAFDSSVTQVGHAISGRGPILLVLDNFEQVVQHALDTVGYWLKMAPEATFLVTSREPLRLPGEEVFLLEPLAEQQGVELFVLRARSAGASWQDTEQSRAAIAKIVGRLDGLPLAIELTAARARLLSPEQILERLSQRFKLLRGSRRGNTERQRTLWGLITWSWDLLEPWEQGALAQLSVFRDGFFMEAAEQVLDLSAWPNAPWSLDVVSSLLEKSLLRNWEAGDQPRFGMFVSIQEFAAEKLRGDAGTESDDQAAAYLRHAAWFARFGSEEFKAECGDFNGDLRKRMVLKLAPDLENLLAGVDTSLAAEEAEAAAGCALAAAIMFLNHGPYSVGVALLERVLAQPVSPVTRARLVRLVGDLLQLNGRIREAEKMFHQALALYRQVGNRGGEIRSVLNIAFNHRLQGRISEALKLVNQALLMLREIGNRRDEAYAVSMRGTMQYDLGHIPEALESMQRALPMAREAGEHRAEGILLNNLALLHQEQVCAEKAEEYWIQALACNREVDSRRGEHVALGGLGILHQEQGRLDEGLKCYEQALGIARELGDRRWEGNHLGCLGSLLHAQGRSETGLEYQQQALAIARELVHCRREGIVLGNLGELMLDQGDLAIAEEYFELAITIGDEQSHRNSGIVRGFLALIRAQQGAFEEACSLIARGEAQLRGVYRLGLGKLLWKKARVEHLAGDPSAAAAALAEAESIAVALSLTPESELRTAITAARALIGPG